MGVIIALAAFALPAHAQADVKPFFDARLQAREATPPAATRALERRLGDQAVVDLDDVTRTPRLLTRLDGALSGPAAGAPEDAALSYVRANLAALGLRQADLGTLRPPAVDTSGGVTIVRWRQAVDGIAAADNELRVHLDRDGRVLSVLGSPASGLEADTTPALTAGEAVRAVQADTGAYRALPRQSGGPRSVTFADGTTATLALFTGRLVWRVTYRAGDDAVYDVMIDADTGALRWRANLVKSAVPARVWERHPGDGTTHAVDLQPWLDRSDRLSGPNVHAYTDTGDDNESGLEDQVIPGDYAFVPFPCAGATPCSWSGAGDSWQANLKQNAVQAFYFANRFHDHLASLGFTDRSFEGLDRLIVEASDGIAAAPPQGNNAYMYTPPDGVSPLMQLQLWDQSAGLRNVNSGDDASIVYHEYTHGLSNRLITDAGGVGALNREQAGAIGEALSDWYAKDFIVGQFPELDTRAGGEVHMGEFTGKSIRMQAIDCAVGAAPALCPAPVGGAGPGGFTYGDYGKIFRRPEIHADGEIWAQTLWDLRNALGSGEARRVITAAMRLSPPEPSFLDMRNAILQAAADSAQRDRLWTVFAARGMGALASTTGAHDVSPKQDFSLPAPPPPPPPPPATPTPSATVQPTPVATASPQPTPTASPIATPRPAFALSASGRRSIKVRATCRLTCLVRAELRVDARTAKRLGASRTVGTYRRTLKAGTTTLTVNLSSSAKRGLRSKVKSFRATLTVRSGSVVTTRNVTVKR